MKLSPEVHTVFKVKFDHFDSLVFCIDYCTWNARAHFPIANCAVLVLSKQSTQFVRTTPCCFLKGSSLRLDKPLHLEIPQTPKL